MSARTIRSSYVLVARHAVALWITIVVAFHVAVAILMWFSLHDSTLAGVGAFVGILLVVCLATCAAALLRARSIERRATTDVSTDVEEFAGGQSVRSNGDAGR